VSTTPHAPRWGLRIAAQSSRTVGVDVFAYDHALGMPADERTGVEPRALVTLRGPSRLPWHVVRRLFREAALPALRAQRDASARHAARRFVRLLARGEVLFATGVEPGSGYGFSASLYTSVEGEQ